MNKNKNEETENVEWKNVNLIQKRYYKCQRNITNQTKNVIRSKHIQEIYHEIPVSAQLRFNYICI